MPRSLITACLAAAALAAAPAAADADLRIDVHIKGELTESWQQSYADEYECVYRREESGRRHFRFQTPGRQKLTYDGDSGWGRTAVADFELERAIDGKTILSPLPDGDGPKCTWEPEAVEGPDCDKPVSWRSKLQLRHHASPFGFAWSYDDNYGDCGLASGVPASDATWAGRRDEWYDKLVGNPWRKIKKRRKVVIPVKRHIEKKIRGGRYVADVNYTVKLWIVGSRRR